MDLDDQVELEHLLFTERKCRSCGVVKTLMEDFYLTRKNRTTLSSYSYHLVDGAVSLESYEWIILSRVFLLDP